MNSAASGRTIHDIALGHLYDAIWHTKAREREGTEFSQADLLKAYLASKVDGLYFDAEESDKHKMADGSKLVIENPGDDIAFEPLFDTGMLVLSNEKTLTMFAGNKSVQIRAAFVHGCLPIYKKVKNTHHNILAIEGAAPRKDYFSDNIAAPFTNAALPLTAAALPGFRLNNQTRAPEAPKKRGILSLFSAKKTKPVPRFEFTKTGPESGLIDYAYDYAELLQVAEARLDESLKQQATEPAPAAAEAQQDFPDLPLLPLQTGEGLKQLFDAIKTSDQKTFHEDFKANIRAYDIPGERPHEYDGVHSAGNIVKLAATLRDSLQLLHYSPTEKKIVEHLASGSPAAYRPISIVGDVDFGADDEQKIQRTLQSCSDTVFKMAQDYANGINLVNSANPSGPLKPEGKVKRAKASPKPK